MQYHSTLLEEPHPMGLPISNAKLAMWLFLATEIMFFSGLIGAYVVLRFGATFWPRPHDVHLVEWMGAFNTFVLICSSVTVVMAHKALTNNDSRRAIWLIFLTLALAGVFLVVKAVEYRAKYDHHILPGGVNETVSPDYLHTMRTEVLARLQAIKAPDEEQKKVAAEVKEFLDKADAAKMTKAEESYRALQLSHKVADALPTAELPQVIPAGNLWASLYFTLTGIHALHVIGGMVIFLIMLTMAAAGKFGVAQTQFVEMAGLYWHFVDIVWIFLFPLLYLIG